MVNRAMAQSLWPDGETPVDKTLWLPFGSETPARISGAVEDFSQSSMDAEVSPDIYIPWELWSPERMYMLVRSDGDMEALIPGVRAAVWSVDEGIPITSVRSMEEVVNRTMADSRLTTLLLMVFGVLALTLGAVGVYGVASYAVTQSTFEIGVRMALGAGREGVMVGILRRFLGLAGTGILLGIAVALGASRVLESLLYQVSATDPVVFGGVAAILALVALVAVTLPAFRASRVEPARVLKQE
jgi:ABC-type antimicrobial peptide transport system permease subunit